LGKKESDLKKIAWTLGKNNDFLYYNLFIIKNKNLIIIAIKLVICSLKSKVKKINLSKIKNKFPSNKKQRKNYE